VPQQKKFQIIKELAEWIDEAFSRKANEGDQKGYAYQLSPSSETEMDDPGITFVPKKYQNGSPCMDDQGVDDGTKEEEFDAEGATARILSASQELDRKERVFADSLPRTPVVRSTPQASETPKGSQAGTPITETELMRRRRLLDYHIFE